MSSAPTKPSAENLVEALHATRIHTQELVADLKDEQLLGPRLPIVNPLRWEVGHVGWFQEFWMLRHLGRQPPILKNGDELYDSARVAHDTRWDLPLLKMDETLAYLQLVLERVGDEVTSKGQVLKDAEGYTEEYFLSLVLFHEQMHQEAFTYTRQTLSYPAPAVSSANMEPFVDQMRPTRQANGCVQTENHSRGYVQIPGGKFVLGSSPANGFVFDNELLAHEIEIAPFAISKTAVTNAEFERFVEDDGYRRPDLWTAAGWQWRASVASEHPVYWRRDGNGFWLRRNFDEWRPLEEHLPVIHINWFEADAYCRWSGQRLPTEAEWELAASGELESEGSSIRFCKRTRPWGEDAATSKRANLGWEAMGCLPADALPAGDSAFGCRQMIGNVWEWTATTFGPYPGFVPGPYKEYSEPWFGDHKVLRGGCWVTNPRLIRNAYRNFYTPDRRDVWAGFRTCAP